MTRRTKATTPMAMPIQAPAIDFLSFGALIGVREGVEVDSVETGGHVCVERSIGNESVEEEEISVVASEREVTGEVIETADVSKVEDDSWERVNESKVAGSKTPFLGSEVGEIVGESSTGDWDVVEVLGLPGGLASSVCPGVVDDAMGSRGIRIGTVLIVEGSCSPGGELGEFGIVKLDEVTDVGGICSMGDEGGSCAI